MLLWIFGGSICVSIFPLLLLLLLLLLMLMLLLILILFLLLLYLDTLPTVTRPRKSS